LHGVGHYSDGVRPVSTPIARRAYRSERESLLRDPHAAVRRLSLAAGPPRSAQRMIDAFRELYGDTGHVRVFRAPGRVNLIGEHTDYNLGFVMPMALDLATCIGTAPASGGKLRIYSEQHKELREWPVTRLADAVRSGHWTDYPLGVARELIRAGYA